MIFKYLGDSLVNLQPKQSPNYYVRILKYINIKDNVILLDKITSTEREIISNGFALSMTEKPRISRLLTK